MRKTFAAVIVAAGVGMCAQGLAAASTTPPTPPTCRIVYARGTDTSNPPRSIVAHVCDRIEVDVVIGTQGQIVPDWNVSRRPSKKVVKFVSKTYGAADSNGDATQRFHFRAVGKGKTSVKFRETTPSPGYGTLGTFTVKITVLPRRTGGTAPLLASYPGRVPSRRGLNHFGCVPLDVGNTRSNSSSLSIVRKRVSSSSTTNSMMTLKPATVR